MCLWPRRHFGQRAWCQKELSSVVPHKVRKSKPRDSKRRGIGHLVCQLATLLLDIVVELVDTVFQADGALSNFE